MLKCLYNRDSWRYKNESYLYKYKTCIRNQVLVRMYTRRGSKKLDALINEQDIEELESIITNKLEKKILYWGLFP